MKKKIKHCKNEGCDNRLWKTTDHFCSYACSEAAGVEKKVPKKRKAIPPVSPSKAKDLAIYRPIRDKYQAENPICEVRGCDKVATSLHHKMGREGYADDWARENGIKLLWDVRYFMNCCWPCHPPKIHENPEWAYEQGYLLKKL